jgi:uncharacterized protein
MTDPQIPEGVRIERIWAIEATYAPDGAETRAPYRAEHLARMAKLHREGILVAAGAYTDVSKSIVLIRAETEEEALAIAREDPYVPGGVWVEVRVKPFGLVVVEAAGA